MADRGPSRLVRDRSVQLRARALRSLATSGRNVSPILSALPVIMTEIGWSHMFQTVKSQSDVFFCSVHGLGHPIASQENLESLRLRVLQTKASRAPQSSWNWRSAANFLDSASALHALPFRICSPAACWQVRHPVSAGRRRLLITWNQVARFIGLEVHSATVRHPWSQ